MLRQWQTPYGTPFAVVSDPMGKYMYAQYLASGQIKGAIYGLTPSAAYELLLKDPGDAVRSTDALSTGSLTVLGFLIVGNIVYLRERRLRGKKKE